MAMSEIGRDAGGGRGVAAPAPVARGHRRRDTLKRSIDASIVLSLLTPAIAGTLTGGGDEPGHVPALRPLAVTIAVATTLALIARRRYPIPVLAALVIAAAIIEL